MISSLVETSAPAPQQDHLPISSPTPVSRLSQMIPQFPLTRMTKRLTLRKRVASACVQCKKSRIRCDDIRPCKRCQRSGKEKTCSQTEKSQAEMETSQAPLRSSVVNHPAPSWGEGLPDFSTVRDQPSFSDQGIVSQSNMMMCSRLSFHPTDEEVRLAVDGALGLCKLPSLSSLLCTNALESDFPSVNRFACSTPRDTFCIAGSFQKQGSPHVQSSGPVAFLDQLIAHKREELNVFLSRLRQHPQTISVPFQPLSPFCGVGVSAHPRLGSASASANQWTCFPPPDNISPPWWSAPSHRPG